MVVHGGAFLSLDKVNSIQVPFEIHQKGQFADLFCTFKVTSWQSNFLVREMTALYKSGAQSLTNGKHGIYFLMKIIKSNSGPHK